MTVDKPPSIYNGIDPKSLKHHHVESLSRAYTRDDFFNLPRSFAGKAPLRHPTKIACYRDSEGYFYHHLSDAEAPSFANGDFRPATPLTHRRYRNPTNGMIICIPVTGAPPVTSLTQVDSVDTMWRWFSNNARANSSTKPLLLSTPDIQTKPVSVYSLVTDADYKWGSREP